MTLIQSPRPYGTQFPFTDASTLKSIEGTSIPAGLVTDVRLFAAGGTANQYISSIRVDYTQAIVTVSDDNGVLCSAVITYNSNALADSNGGSTASFSDAYGRPAGVLLGSLNQLLATGTIPVGTYNFVPTATEFVSTCVNPQPRVVVEGFVIDGDPNNELFTGDVWFVGGPGIALQWSSTDAGPIVTLNAVGDAMAIRQGCDAAGITDPQIGIPLQALQITGPTSDSGDVTTVVTPDQYGNVQLAIGSGSADDPILRIVPVSNGLQILALGTLS